MHLLVSELYILIERFEVLWKSTQCKLCFTWRNIRISLRIFLSSSCLCEILCKCSVSHNAVEYLWVLRKSTQVRPLFSYRSKWNYIYAPTAKSYDILKAMNAFTHFVYCFRQHSATFLASVTVHWVVVVTRAGERAGLCVKCVDVQ